MFPNVLSREQAGLLELLKREKDLSRFYLAGGTGLALRLGHRRSEGFGFFRADTFDRQAWLGKLGWLGPLSVLQETEGTLTVEIRSVRTSFFHYPYPLLEAPEPAPWGFPVASNADIGAMKLSAVASRGSKKDFFDLHALCSGPLPFSTLLERFRKKFSGIQFDEYHLLRSLAYFEEAEKEPDPVVLQPVTWDRVRAYFRSIAAEKLKS